MSKKLRIENCQNMYKGASNGHFKNALFLFALDRCKLDMFYIKSCTNNLCIYYSGGLHVRRHKYR